MATRDAGSGLDELDAEQPGIPFTVRAAGRDITFAPAAGPGWRDLLEALAWPPAFVDQFGPHDPADLAAVYALSVTQMRALLGWWRLHHGLSLDNADHLRLAAMMSKPAYRAAAERDLWEVHRLDLATEWQSRRWRRLLNLLDGLRRTSHLHEAMTLDDDLARVVLAQQRHDGGQEPAGPRRRMTEFSVEAELLSHAVDRLGELIAVQAAGRGAKPRRVTPMPRPESALAKAQQRQSRRKHQFTVARVFGYVDERGNPTGKAPQGMAPVRPV